MFVRAVRGATTVKENSESCIVSETKRLLNQISTKNQISQSDLISVFFTATNDITAIFPAKGARELGWTNIPLIDALTLNVDNSLKLCIRVMIHFYSDKSHDEIKHIYLNDAVNLRPDLLNM